MILVIFCLFNDIALHLKLLYIKMAKINYVETALCQICDINHLLFISGEGTE